MQEINRLKRKSLKNLPPMFFFTDRKRFTDIFVAIEKLPENSAIIIREYDLGFEEKLKFTKKILEITKQRKIKIFIGKDLKLAKAVKADGIHFSDFDQITLSKLPRNMMISYSCHSQKSLNKALKIKADLVFLSPIFKTSSHVNQKPVGIYSLRKFAQKSQIPTYALGGINDKNIKLLKNSLIEGIGGISFCHP